MSPTDLHILAHITLGIVGEMQEWKSNDGQDIKQEQEQEDTEKLPKLELGPPPPPPEAVRTGAATPKERLAGAWVQRAHLSIGGAVPKVFRVLSQSALL